tara:strand:+ start:16213 stop:17337 length:1125 start_codon:yes stop_codon:yes gene_type:complete
MHPRNCCILAIVFEFKSHIPNESRMSLMSEVCFHPSGRFFAATYTEANEVRLYDAVSLQLMRTFENPEAGFDQPHGVVQTHKHMIVSMSHDRQRPSQLNVYRLDSDTAAPANTFVTPFAELREAHSLAFDNGRLLATYCETTERTGTLVCYAFDDEAGRITGVLDRRTQCFDNLGDAKGVSFFDASRRVVVSYNSFTRKPESAPARTPIRSVMRILRRGGPQNLWQRVNAKLGITRPRDGRLTTDNGFVFFAISPEGKFSQEPERIVTRDFFCRYENVFCQGDLCLAADLINSEILVYDLAQDPGLENPIYRLPVSDGMPHGVKLSPDGTQMIVSTFSLEISDDREVQWGQWLTPRQDKLLVFDVQQPRRAAAA